MIEGRQLSREEIPGIWRIDRAEVIEGVYYLIDGELVLKPEHFAAQGWPPGETVKYTPLLEECHDHGGWFYGFFDGAQPVGVAVLEGRFIGRDRDTLQLEFLHVGRGYRDHGYGRRLFLLAADEARRRGARFMYISATPSEHTINFYLRLGCWVTPEPDPILFEREPEDIHLLYDL
jgi:GNAT superfamily N-acetyltransferase